MMSTLCLPDVIAHEKASHSPPPQTTKQSKLGDGRLHGDGCLPGTIQYLLNSNAYLGLGGWGGGGGGQFPHLPQRI